MIERWMRTNFAGIEPSFKIVHLFAQQMRFATGMQLRVIAVGLDEIDLVNFQQHHPV